jgi:hypothetical protein
VLIPRRNRKCLKAGARDTTLSPARMFSTIQIMLGKRSGGGHINYIKTNYVKLEVSSVSRCRRIRATDGEGGLLHHPLYALHAARRSCAHDFFCVIIWRARVAYTENEAIALGDTHKNTNRHFYAIVQWD